MIIMGDESRIVERNVNFILEFLTQHPFRILLHCCHQQNPLGRLLLFLLLLLLLCRERENRGMQRSAERQ
jgi:hypothetical protein